MVVQVKRTDIVRAFDVFLTELKLFNGFLGEPERPTSVFDGRHNRLDFLVEIDVRILTHQWFSDEDAFLRIF